MAINPSFFNKINVTDTCSVWNIISSRTLYKWAKTQSVDFICTKFVIYECLYKPRKMTTDCEAELCEILQEIITKNNDFPSYDISLEDLQHYDVLKKRKKLGKGELSSIIFAKKIQQALLTDDQEARKLGDAFLAPNVTQTTPHLLSWLMYNRIINDEDFDVVIEEHSNYNRPLTKHFNKARELALIALCKESNK